MLCACVWCVRVPVQRKPFYVLSHKWMCEWCMKWDVFHSCTLYISLDAIKVIPEIDRKFNNLPKMTTKADRILCDRRLTRHGLTRHSTGHYVFYEFMNVSSSENCLLSVLQRICRNFIHLNMNTAIGCSVTTFALNFTHSSFGFFLFIRFSRLFPPVRYGAISATVSPQANKYTLERLALYSIIIYFKLNTECTAFPVLQYCFGK